MMAFCPEHPKWEQNPKFTPLSELDDKHPHPFHMQSPPSGLFFFATLQVKLFCHNYKFLNVNATEDVYFYSFFPQTLRM